ncbi:hypothetical protein KHA80_00805 [Anaerobacillus sp. HL2]|nr:hypothetical protein KHA80_00805 [Anaerobacillus sp. HL2]
MDRAGNTYKNYEELEKLPKKENIEFITTKQKLEIYFHDSHWTEAMLPKQFIIRGYTRSYLVSESINVRLD